MTENKRTIKSPPKPRPSSLQDIKEAVKKAPPKRVSANALRDKTYHPKAAKDKYKDWTRYHIVYTLRHQWKFYREGMKRGDRLTVLVRQKYHARGIKSNTSYRWVYANWFSLKELEEIEKHPYRIQENETPA